MQPTYDVLVVGGGVVGLTAALAMAKRDLTVAVIDAGTLTVHSDRPDLRVYAINQASENLLRQLGVWGLLNEARLSPYSHMHVWDAATGASIDFDARLIADSRLGTIIEESVIKQALLRCMASMENVTLFPEQTVVNIKEEPEHIEVIGEHWRRHTRLLMIADGANSPTRQKLSLPMTTWSYHQQALIATVQTEKNHQRTAWQVFHRDGPLAFLPLANDRQCSIVWSTTPSRAKALKMLDEASFQQQLADAFACKLGQIESVSERHTFPLSMRHTRQYVGKNWLLLGDAAHTIHPLAGLGLNIGLADVASWLTCLDQGYGLTAARTLLAYQRRRKHAVWQSIALMQGLKALFANPLPPVAMLRRAGLQWCDRLPPLKRLFIAHAAGQMS
ncbi:FAD-dependent oxidoreductase [Legionella spiritensis]|uniref:2-polyprenyl-6-methoxyphenol hydroxylase n=1 Tax=Legionella spiritensis TaxID=452 RepID=A0A0W0YWI5_LEGSP|nr:FAD-dependent oxidoreductase [Legionella spiritensis]KTD61208.1 2-polyprenyl-6-methoxyphenol hydroxylase [Legionella spiritensis]SNV28243.1 2-polyprenyl-6-methoxyphenol hydroxylase [Legionella spiritensis]